ncbi:MAG: PSD1 and planctomycete cytochrome C domain-containing protein [Bryobacteraceae bacterium]|nr:PSD1 and planctomycete cytochrome C domain-containing protein [Bryobacteraceae bacterium]
MQLVLSLLVTVPLWAAGPPDFKRDIAPILNAQCAACHAGKTKTSDYSVETLDAVIAGGKRHGKAVIGGHPEMSPLLKLINGQLAPKMPVGRDLAKADVERIEAWIRSLPEDRDLAKRTYRWPYEKPVKPQPPAVQNGEWGRNPIDAFILEKLEANRLKPAAEASKPVLARRVYFDLIGLPPTPEEMNAHLADSSPNAYEKLIDRLLGDPRYGERWARHWLDLVRYGETSGLEGDGAIGNAWRYRDWVIEAFNRDMPYDKFILHQLAGADEHSKTRNNYQPNVQGHVPLGFLRVAPWDRSNLVADEVRQNYLNEVTTTTSAVFLGLTLGCARCHDHKYDPIPTKDFYRFQAFFNAIQVENVEVPYKDPVFAEKAKEKIKEYETRLKDGPEKLALDRLEAELLKKLIAARIEQSRGKELTRTDLRLELKRKDQKVFTESERQQHAELLEDANRTLDPEERKALDSYEDRLLAKLKDGYAARLTDPEGRFEALTAADVRTEAGARTSKVFTSEERTRHRDMSESLDILRRRLGRWRPLALTVRNVPGPPNGPNLPLTHVLTRGDYRQPAEAVEAGFPTAITGKAETPVIEQDRYRQFPTRGWRITLAKWIASPDNPLTARVMVNRLWQHHFGAGIVATPSDFGVNGSRPTHPALVDWMAHRFIEEGWSIKAMHRLMLTSATYRQSSDNAAMSSNTGDPDNTLLWRFNRRRLEAEEIRDSILQISGRLNPEHGGPSVFPPLPADLADFARYGRGGALMWEPNEKDEDARRRSIYTFQRRSMPLPMMASFDAPVFSESCERRSSTVTPLQALNMMNGDLIHQEAAHLARLAEKQGGATRGAQVEALFRVVLSRKPTAEEAAQFSKFSGGLEGLCRVLLNSNEFLYLD